VKQTVIVDFDGVLHSYSSGWKGADVISDPPTEGASEAMYKLREKYVVVVVSSRCHQAGGSEAIRNWLALHGIVVDEVTSNKPPHIVVIDDRALRFEGDWNKTLTGIEAASVPWNKKDHQP
jgi:ribonucleotide monophosphatase NagD (HAD superfamily)